MVVVSIIFMVGVVIFRVFQVFSVFIIGIGNIFEQDVGGEEKELEDLLLVRDLNGGLEMLWQGLSVCVGKIEGWFGNFIVFGDFFLSVSFVLVVVVGVSFGSVVFFFLLGIQKLFFFVEVFFVLCEKFKLGVFQFG